MLTFKFIGHRVVIKNYVKKKIGTNKTVIKSSFEEQCSLTNLSYNIRIKLTPPLILYVELHWKRDLGTDR